MPFQSGVNWRGNRYGRRRADWINEKRKIKEARKSYDKLCALRDGMVLERKVILVDGAELEVEVVPSHQEYRKVCAEILNRSIGKPAQQITVSGDPKNPLFNRELLKSLPDSPDLLVLTRQLTEIVLLNENGDGSESAPEDAPASTGRTT